MNHIRNRYALIRLIEKMKFSPVILIQGPRQCGKSFLVKNLLSKKMECKYKTLDLAATKRFAEENPDTFVRAEKEKDQILIIDEAQKVPAIFDSVKAVVDEERRPGQYILLGSTEFSKLTRIRESLTGRASRLRLFPLTLSETKHLPLNTSNKLFQSTPRLDRSDLMKYLKNGGMPGLFGIRNDVEKIGALQDWIELTVYRDASNFYGVKCDPELLMRILESIAQLDEPMAGNISKLLRVDLRKIKTHLTILTTLFVINRVDPHPLGTGKPHYFFCDVGFLNHFKASFHKKLRTWLYQEVTAYLSYNQFPHKRFYYYRTSKGTIIDLVITENDQLTQIAQLFSEEIVSTKRFAALTSLKESVGEKIETYALTGTLSKMKDHQVQIIPWESIA